MKNKAYTIVCLLAIAGAAVWIATGWLSLRNREQNTAAETSPDASAPAAAENTTPLTTLRFDTRTVDFGNVPSDTLLEARFVLRNTGDYPLSSIMSIPTVPARDIRFPNRSRDPGTRSASLYG